MKQGFSHLGTAGSTSHHDCVLSLPADWPGRATGMITLVWGVTRLAYQLVTLEEHLNQNSHSPEDP